jgi:hypothetical protein
VLPVHVTRLDAGLENVAEILPRSTQLLQAWYQELGGDQRISELRQRAEVKVRAITEAGAQTQKFRGKEILGRFFKEHGRKAGFSYATFVYELAKQVKSGKRFKELINPTIVRLQTFIPSELIETLDAIVVSPLDDALPGA